MRLVMMGTGPFAVPTFVSLLDSQHTVAALMTRPVPPATGRKKETTVPNPMRDEAERRGVPTFAPDSVNSAEAQATLRELAADLFVVCDYGQILSNETLSLAKKGGINLHGSLLPRHRGAAPIQWTILSGDTDAGITVIHMTPRLDGGPCLVKRAVEIGPYETSGELEPRLAELGVGAVHEALEMLEPWDGQATLGALQDSALVTKAPRLNKRDGQIDWSLPAEVIARRIRALQPWPGSYTSLAKSSGDPMRLILLRATPVENLRASAPGTFVGESNELVVACGEGALRIERLQPAGKRPMDAAEFLRGNKFDPDWRLVGEA
jgi:methionyl-tRNA formyltransferase